MATLVILFQVLVNRDKFLDHLLTASLAITLFGTGFIQLNELKNKSDYNRP